MSQTITLDGATRAMGKLYEQLRWGASTERPGLADTLAVTNYHMGVMIELLHVHHEAAVREIRDRNLAGLPYDIPAHSAGAREVQEP